MPRAPSEPPVARRLRVVRRRITAATLATFVAAWLAVAALGKGGSTSTAATSPSPTTGTSGQKDGNAGPAQSSGEWGSDAEGPAQSGQDMGGSSSSGPDSGSSQSSGQGGPVTSSQS
jgi:hypothetical protein